MRNFIKTKNLLAFNIILLLSSFSPVYSQTENNLLTTKIVSIFDKVPLDAEQVDIEEAKVPYGSSEGVARLFGSKNSFVSFNLLLSASNHDLNSLAVRLPGFSSKSGEIIKNSVTSAKDAFDFNNKKIELFFTRYLEIKGLSKLSYEAGYDERHIPIKLRRPWNGEGVGRGVWKDRPHANKQYPDILVPLEAVPNFSIKQGLTQSIVGDIYLDKGQAAGIYSGKIEILEKNKLIKEIPIEIEVLDFILPDKSPASGLVYIESADIANRYLGERYPQSIGQQNNLDKIVDNHFKLAHRHGISLFDKNEGFNFNASEARPRDAWIPRLSGELFTSKNGYSGPAANLGNDIFVIGSYGTWLGKENPNELKRYAAQYQNWFDKNFAQTDVVFYLADESTNWVEQETWAKNVKIAAPRLKTFATVPLPEANNHIPSLDIAASWFNFGSTQIWEKALASWRAKGKDFILYNGKRPLTGSFATEDDGIALRVLSWSQVKMGIKRWFFWNGTYYKNFQGGTGDTNLFTSAHTFGGKDKVDSIIGETGWNYSNGDGVLFYPGTDKLFATDSYGLDGPIASLRLKLWRAGIEDAKYIELAYQKNPSATKQIMNLMLPKTLWQVGVAEESDPTWKKTDISWTTDSAVWERARRELAKIILSNK